MFLFSTVTSSNATLRAAARIIVRDNEPGESYNLSRSKNKPLIETTLNRYKNNTKKSRILCLFVMFHEINKRKCIEFSRIFEKYKYT